MIDKDAYTNKIRSLPSKALHSPLVIGLCYLVLIPAFGIVYFLKPSFWENPLTAIQSGYFSVVTITTLGYGDIAPKTEPARIIVAIEALLGVVTIGFFLNAVARRSDEDKEVRRKEVIKSHLRSQYQEWRRGPLNVCLLEECGGYGADLVLEDELVNFRRFRDYFAGSNNQRFYDVINGLQSNDKLIEEIFVISEMFAQQVNYALGSIHTEDKEALATLTRVAQRPYLLKRLDVYSADPAKYVGNYLFEILAMFSIMTGNLEEDFIESAIQRL